LDGCKAARYRGSPGSFAPFCGHRSEVTIDWRGVGFRGDCYRCGASIPFGATPLEAARRWNERGS